MDPVIQRGTEFEKKLKIHLIQQLCMYYCAYGGLQRHLMEEKCNVIGGLASEKASVTGWTNSSEQYYAIWHSCTVTRRSHQTVELVPQWGKKNGNHGYTKLSFIYLTGLCLTQTLFAIC